MVEQLTEYQKEFLQHRSERTTKGYQAVSYYTQVFSANTTLGIPINMTTDTTGSGSIVSPTENNPWVGLSVTTANGDEAVYQSKRYLRYWAYRTHKATFAVSFDTAVANTTQEAGVFDANDGWFFRFSDSGLQLVLRSGVTGSPVDTVISQDDFNLDRLDGDGPSGLRVGLDIRFDRGVTYGIQYNWYGTQVVKFFIAYGGSVVYLHEQIFTGTLDGVPFSRTASLPLRFAISNSDTAASGSTMRVGTVSHSVGDDASGDVFDIFSASNGTTAVTVDSTTTWQDLIAIRPLATKNGITNRGLMELRHWLLLCEGNSIEYRIIDNVTYTGGSWTSVGGTSFAEYSASPGTQAGTPRVIDVNYLYSGRNDGGQTPENDAQSNIKIGLDTITGAQYCFVIQARKLSAATATAFAAITWEEQN